RVQTLGEVTSQKDTRLGGAGCEHHAGRIRLSLKKADETAGRVPQEVRCILQDLVPISPRRNRTFPGDDCGQLVPLDGNVKVALARNELVAQLASGGR